VEDDISERWIPVMIVGSPTARSNVHFDIAVLWRTLAKLNHRAAKIRSTFDASKSGMQHLDWLTIARLHLVAQ
jgi:hypothetical protein